MISFIFAVIVSLTWDSASGNILGYRLYVTDINGNKIESIDVGLRTSFDYQVLVGIGRFFAVRGYNDGGLGPPSNVVAAFASDYDCRLPESTGLPVGADICEEFAACKASVATLNANLAAERSAKEKAKKKCKTMKDKCGTRCSKLNCNLK